jgi:hypothetical protein
MLVIVAVIAVAGIAFGRLRHETPATMAMNVGGYALFMIGLGWAQSFGEEAFLAAGAASLGSLMFTSAASRKPRARDIGLEGVDPHSG